MSMILKGIDLPKMGEGRRIVIYDNGDVVVNEEGWGEDGYKHYRTSYDVKAIQIPKGHGRIIDEDEAFENVACFHGTAWLDTEGIKPLLEAEEEK